MREISCYLSHIFIRRKTLQAGDYFSNEQGQFGVIDSISGGTKDLLFDGGYENFPHFYYTTNDKGQQDQLVKTMKDKGGK
jgi:hypothetical protein